jgi:hypothetical protein
MTRLILHRETSIAANWAPRNLFPMNENNFAAALPDGASTVNTEARRAGREEGRTLFFEDLRHELCLNLIQLLQGCLQGLPVFVRSFAEDVLEAKRCSLHEQFGIF